jgi:hypothetical protein
MGLERATLLACAVLGTLLATAMLYFTAAPLLDLWPVPTPAAPIPMTNGPLIPPFVWWLISIFALALLATAWIGFYRNRSIEFFPTRHILHEKYSSLERRVSGVSTLWAIWAVGTRFVDSQSKSVMKHETPYSTESG